MQRILTFEQFVFEHSDESLAKNGHIHQVLFKNRDHIKDEANIDDFLFNQVVDELTKNPPLSGKEEDVVDDAIKLALIWKPEAIPYMKMDQGDRMADEIIGNRDGKTGVAIQNYDNGGPSDSQNI